MIKFKDLTMLCDHWIAEQTYAAYLHSDNINFELGNLIKDLEKFYGKRDDDLPWDELDRDMVFQEVIECMLDSCRSDECVNILAIFCLDRGLFFCQMGGLKKQAYEEYLLSAVISSKRLAE